MKKLILLFIAAGAGFSAMAQVRGGDNFFAQKYVVDLDFPVGVLLQTPTSSIPANYNNVAYSDISKLKMSTGMTYGADLEFGYFFGLMNKFGIGAGIQYLQQTSDAQLGNFRVDYEATDSKGNLYRQILSSENGIKEKLTTTSINIPVVLKYKTRFTTKIGLSIDAGILYNIEQQNKWKTDATFDYEAAYAFSPGTGPGKGSPTLYDNNVTPLTTDWLVTKEMYARTISEGTVPGVFDSLRKRGYNVALGTKPTTNNGTISYTTGSIGFIIRPAINVRLTQRLHLKLGAFYTYQSFNNKTISNYKLTDNMGSSYSSLLNTVSTSVNSTMGINIGLRYFIGTPTDKQFDGKYDE